MFFIPSDCTIFARKFVQDVKKGSSEPFFM